MHRRDFIKVVAGSAVTWPLAARAQQPTLPVVGFVNLASAKGGYAQNWSAFLKGLSEAGYVDGRNVVDRIPTGRKAEPIGCRRWWLIWFVVKSP